MKKYRLSRLPMWEIEKIVIAPEKILELLRWHIDDLEFSQHSFIFFTSWEGTHLKGIKIPVDKSYSQYIEEQEKF